MAEEKEFNTPENEEVVNEQVDQEQAEPSTEDATQDQPEANTEEKRELTWEEKYADVNDRFIRLHAEFDNYRKRTNKEKIDLISNANAGVLKDLLAVVDDFERAIANNEKVEDIAAVKEGFQLIYNKFKHILEGKGLKPMQSVGEAFDSELHEAIANVPAPSEEQKGKIIDDVEKGYYLNDKVIRFAKVVVGQ